MVTWHSMLLSRSSFYQKVNKKEHLRLLKHTDYFELQLKQKFFHELGRSLISVFAEWRPDKRRGMSADFDIVVIPFVSPLSFYGSRICSDGGTVCSVFIPSCLWLRLERWEQYNDFRLVKIFCRKRHIQQQQRHTVYQRNNFAGRKKCVI